VRAEIEAMLQRLRAELERREEMRKGLGHILARWFEICSSYQ
jgi:hypothetical protein